MPTIFHDRGLRYFFYSEEGNPREPVHAHVERDGAQAKIWVGETLELAYNHGLNRRDLAMAMLVVRARKREIMEAWYGHFH
jgi:Domain of unknown function (DUF4160)